MNYFQLLSWGPSLKRDLSEIFERFEDTLLRPAGELNNITCCPRLIRTLIHTMEVINH